MKLQPTILAAIILGAQLYGKSRECGAEIKLTIIAGRPVADCVFVNGQGPYRFLIDTGTEVNELELDLARKSGMQPTFQADMISPLGVVHLPGADNLEVTFGGARAGNQKFLFSDLYDVHQLSPDIEGILGQSFLSHFDYVIDFAARRLRFGAGDFPGTRVPLLIRHGVPAVETSLGILLLDSGAEKVTFFGVGHGDGEHAMRTASGLVPVGLIEGNSLTIGGRNIRYRDAIAVQQKTESVDAVGLLPTGLFHAVCVSNSEGFVLLN